MTAHLSILNPEPRRLPGPELLHELVSKPTLSNHAAIEYLSHDGCHQTITYNEFHERSNALAQRLTSSCAASQPARKTGFVVPLYIPQTPELYIAQLAVLKAGGAFCPMTLDAPEERLRYILKDVDAKLLLTVKDFRERLPQDLGVEIICADEQAAESSGTQLSPELAASQPAYVM